MRPFALTIHSGIVVAGDAISGSVRSKIAICRRLQAEGVPLQVTVFTQHTDTPEPEILVRPAAHLLFGDPHFNLADAHLFEFGIHYDLFNAVFVIPESKPVVAVYHNVTPPHLAEAGQRPILERSLRQRYNLFRAGRIACVSEYNRDDLAALGIPSERLSVTHLPPAITARGPTRGTSGQVELLFVGRFVRAKGIADLLAAFSELRRRGVSGFRITLAGNSTFASEECREQIHEVSAATGPGSALRVLNSPADAELAELYGASDALVIPSYHEGLCLPALEALAAGCYVIAYDTGNLPRVLGGLGTLVPAGDVASLASAMAELIGELQGARSSETAPRLPLGKRSMTLADWSAAVERHLDDYSPERYRRGFEELLLWSAARSPNGAHLVRALESRAAEPAA